MFPILLQHHISIILIKANIFGTPLIILCRSNYYILADIHFEKQMRPIGNM